VRLLGSEDRGAEGLIAVGLSNVGSALNSAPRGNDAMGHKRKSSGSVALSPCDSCRLTQSRASGKSSKNWATS
jgi:hypothetical protein